MSTRGGEMIVVSKTALRDHALRGVLLGLLAAVALGAWGYKLPLEARPDIINVPLEQACAWPRQEGEMTVVTVMNGKLICWRWI